MASAVDYIVAVAAAGAVMAACYGYGFHNGKIEAEHTALTEKNQAVQAAIEQALTEEKKKQNELTALNKSLSSDNAKLNRLLKSKGTTPPDYKSCLIDRDRLRRMVKEGTMLVAECRKGLGYCNIQLGK